MVLLLVLTCVCARDYTLECLVYKLWCLQEIHRQAVRLQSVEGELLELLSQQHTPQLEDTKLTKAILTLNTAYEDSQER